MYACFRVINKTTEVYEWTIENAVATSCSKTLIDNDTEEGRLLLHNLIRTNNKLWDNVTIIKEVDSSNKASMAAMRLRSLLQYVLPEMQEISVYLLREIRTDADRKNSRDSLIAKYGITARETTVYYMLEQYLNSITKE